MRHADIPDRDRVVSAISCVSSLTALAVGWVMAAEVAVEGPRPIARLRRAGAAGRSRSMAQQRQAERAAEIAGLQALLKQEARERRERAEKQSKPR
jgi:hypothetical protein